MAGNKRGADAADGGNKRARAQEGGGVGAYIQANARKPKDHHVLPTKMLVFPHTDRLARRALDSAYRQLRRPPLGSYRCLTGPEHVRVLLVPLFLYEGRSLGTFRNTVEGRAARAAMGVLQADSYRGAAELFVCLLRDSPTPERPRGSGRPLAYLFASFPRDVKSRAPRNGNGARLWFG